jgi:lipopolysaccharide/colanic/teichoic acid biosynthesis glycosyltransferase
MIKRAFDMIGAGVGLVLLLPLLVAIAGWIKFDSAGPVLFRQVRVGRFGCRFRIHKFRSMTLDAAAQGPAITASRDPRITRAGKYLRRYKLDELPQLIDVLVGDMSLVGPRPEVPEFVAHYPAISRDEILSVRPGITDDTSLRFRHENELLGDARDPRIIYIEKILPLKVASYVEYVRTRTLWGDLRILFRTARAFLKT